MRDRMWKGTALVAVGAPGGGAALPVASVVESNEAVHACVDVTTMTGEATVPRPPDRWAGSVLARVRIDDRQVGVTLVTVLPRRQARLR
jgi:hypothetical protein